jgi:hypothetical protein
MDFRRAPKKHADEKFPYSRCIELIELAQKTFSLGLDEKSDLSRIPREITIDNFPPLIDTCPIIKRVYTFRVRLHAMEKAPSMTDGQKMALLIDSARGISQLARVLCDNSELIEKIKNRRQDLTSEEESVMDDLTVALSRILLSRSVTIKKKRSPRRKKETGEGCVKS